jgi:hypothetical protein
MLAIRTGVREHTGAEHPDAGERPLAAQGALPI